MVVAKLTDAQKAERAAAKRAKRLEGLEERAGFLRVWRALCACGKPLIGHNCFFDLLFLHVAFEGALPPSLAEFKPALSKRIGVAYDTKILACDSGLISPSDTMLGPLHAAMAKQPGAPSCSLGDGCERYLENAAEHEAGYDAYLTGCCFAIMQALGHAPSASAGRLHLNNSIFALRLHHEDDTRAELNACILHLALLSPPAGGGGEAAAANEASASGVGEATAAKGAPKAAVRTHDVLVALQPIQAQRVRVRVRWFSDCEAFVWLTPLAAAVADAADGATSDSVAAVDCAAAIECLSALAVKVSPVDEWLATQQQAEEEAAKAEEAAAKAEGQQQQAGVQKEVQPAAAAKAAADAPAEPSSGGRAAAKPKQSKKRAREAAAKEEEEAEEEESKAVKRVTRTRSGSK